MQYEEKKEKKQDSQVRMCQTCTDIEIRAGTSRSSRGKTCCGPLAIPPWDDFWTLSFITQHNAKSVAGAPKEEKGNPFLLLCGDRALSQFLPYPYWQTLPVGLLLMMTIDAPHHHVCTPSTFLILWRAHGPLAQLEGRALGYSAQGLHSVTVRTITV